MRDLTKLVALSEVGKSVEIKIWREKRLITKKVILGRLESSKEYLSENKKEPRHSDEFGVHHSLFVSSYGFRSKTQELGDTDRFKRRP